VYRRIATDAMAEIRRLDPVIQHPAGTGFDPGDLDTIEGLYTTESTGRGPFTISELKQ
jgi:hypothetical protein